MMLVDFYALSWIGMWMALRTKRHHRAIFATLARMMLLPWLTILFFIFVSIGSRGPREDEMLVYCALWFGLGAVIECVLAARAKMGLREELRQTPVPPDLLLLSPPLIAPPPVIRPRDA